MARADGALQLLLSPTPQPVLTYGAIGRVTSIFPQDIAHIEVSAIVGMTDVVIRLEPDAAAAFNDWTDLATGFELSVSICAHRVLDTVIEQPITTGTLYIPNLSAQQARALRALWHGRHTCSDLPPEVFPYG